MVILFKFESDSAQIWQIFKWKKERSGSVGEVIRGRDRLRIEGLLVRDSPE